MYSCQFLPNILQAIASHIIQIILPMGEILHRNMTQLKSGIASAIRERGVLDAVRMLRRYYHGTLVYTGTRQAKSSSQLFQCSSSDSQY